MLTPLRLDSSMDRHEIKACVLATCSEDPVTPIAELITRLHNDEGWHKIPLPDLLAFVETIDFSKCRKYKVSTRARPPIASTKTPL
jgi:hypothetical protein